MAVGEHDPGDRSFRGTATVIIGRRRFPDQAVYGDDAAPRRRDVFLGKEVRRKVGRLPQNGRVEWYGRTYDAELSFRTKADGGRVPVYEFFVEG